MAPQRADQTQRRTAPKMESEMTPAELEEKTARAARLKARVAGSIAEYATSAGHDNEAIRAAKDQDAGALKRKTPLVDDEDEDEKSNKPAGKKTAKRDDDDEEVVEKPAEKQKSSASIAEDDQDEVAGDAETAHMRVTKKTTATKSKANATSTGPKKATTRSKTEPKLRKEVEPRDKIEKIASNTKKKAAPRKTKNAAAKVIDDEDEDGEHETPVPTPIPQVITVQHGKNAAKYLGMIQKLEDKILNEGAEPDADEDIFQAVLMRFDEARVHLVKVEREGSRLKEESKKTEIGKPAGENQSAEAKAAEEVPSAAEEERTSGVVLEPIAANAETGKPAFAPVENEAVSQESTRSATTAQLTNGTAAAELEAPQQQDTTPETAQPRSCASAVVVSEEHKRPAMQVADESLLSPTIPKDMSSASQEERFADDNRYRFIREIEQTVPAFTSAPVLAAPPLPTFASVPTHAPALGQQVGYTAPTKSIGDVLSELRQHAVDLGTVRVDTAQVDAAEATTSGENQTGQDSSDIADLAAPAKSLLRATEEPGLGATVTNDVVDGEDG
ncbi:hypothetical protein LTR78_001371 [Recurvomyces mirabilis]|uniref:Uncharacterized protein n=1 Tax=Recurvomyces mirabilis TaxID=574656 RepID=A0AAE0WVY3_9PEZI|nr:hypothetical protein LTR78_001371 [Recurvomyces mirabilis]KAK5161348.1 hypothetical protein LTS14_001144 [Recurvomyces mirabilis]